MATLEPGDEGATVASLAERRALHDVADPVALDAKAVEIAARYARGPLVALRAAKIAINRGLQVDLSNGMLIEREVFVNLFATEDQKIGMRTFIEKGPGKADFVGR